MDIKKNHKEKSVFQDSKAIFEGVEKEIHIAPIIPSRDLPLRVTRFGITNPDPDYRVKRTHSAAYVIEYIISGHGYLKINGEKHKLCAGDAYIIHIGDECYYHSDKNDPYKKCWINFVPDFFFTNMLNAYGIKDRVFRGLDLSLHFERVMKLQSISNFTEDICIPASRIILDMIMDMAEHTEKQATRSYEELAAQIQLKLNQSITKNVKIEDIARELYRSTNDVIWRFKKKYGITPYAYLIELRINTAKELLVNTSKSIKEISEYLCFFSEYHFSNIFKKKVGVSPGKFRKQGVIMPI